MIDRSSPVKQNIGDFVDEEEKILSLFKVTNIFASSHLLSKVENQATRRVSRTPSVASL